MRQGITHFDTARSYGRGYSEKLLGEFFRAHGGALAVTTKFGVTYSKTDACPTAIALPLNWAWKKLKGAVGGGLGLAPSNLPPPIQGSASRGDNSPLSRGNSGLRLGLGKAESGPPSHKASEGLKRKAEKSVETIVRS